MRVTVVGCATSVSPTRPAWQAWDTRVLAVNLNEA